MRFTMNDLGIKIKNSQMVILEKDCPPPKLNYTYTQSVEKHDYDRIQVICQEKVLLDVHNHAISSHNEVGGILVGNVYKWNGIYFVKVDACIQGTHMETGRTHARFTAETWAQAMSIREKDYPDKVIIGWYHSHPNLGIFLSGMDLEIHKNFFNSPWHVAMVIDAQNNNMGFFGWNGKQIQKVKKFSAFEQKGLPSRYEFSNNNSILNYTNKKLNRDELPLTNLSQYWWAIFVIGIIGGIVIYHFFLRITEPLLKKTEHKNG